MKFGGGLTVGDPGEGLGGPPPPLLIRVKKRKKSQKEEKLAGQTKQRPPAY